MFFCSDAIVRTTRFALKSEKFVFAPIKGSRDARLFQNRQGRPVRTDMILFRKNEQFVNKVKSLF